MNVYLFFLSFLILRSLGSPRPFPDIEYLGMGYNIILGNPSGDMHELSDVGWTINSVIDLTYKENKTTKDGRFILPDQVSGVPAVACNFGMVLNQWWELLPDDRI